MDKPPEIRIIPARSEDEILVIRDIFLEYAASLPIDISFQGFEAECASLPGAYAEPHGCLLLALVDGSPAGCCAVRPCPEADYANACEMKRLYVRPAFRGFGIGRQLVDLAMDAARVCGYHHMLLDTLSDMDVARGIYEDCGFESIPPYYQSPIEDTCFLRAEL